MLLRRDGSGLDIDIPVIVGNHETLRTDVERFGIPFPQVPIEPDTNAAQDELDFDQSGRAGA